MNYQFDPVEVNKIFMARQAFLEEYATPAAFDPAFMSPMYNPDPKNPIEIYRRFVRCPNGYVFIFDNQMGPSYLFTDETALTELQSIIPNMVEMPYVAQVLGEDLLERANRYPKLHMAPTKTGSIVALDPESVSKITAFLAE